MRDRLLESLPLVLVGVVLLAFYLLRAEGPGLAFQPPAALKPTVAPTATPPPIVVQGQRVGSTNRTRVLPRGRPSQAASPRSSQRLGRVWAIRSSASTRWTPVAIPSSE